MFKDERELVSDFYKKTYRSKGLFCVISFLIIAYGIQVFYYGISIDTEAIMYNSDALLLSWLGLGRFSLVFLKKILGLTPFNPYLASILMLFTNIVTIYLLGMCLYKFSSSKKENYKAVIALLSATVFITCPIFAEQFNFLLQSFEVAFTMLTTVLSVYYLSNWILFKGKKNVILALLCSSFSFGGYQANIFMFITLVLGIYVFLIVFKRITKPFICGIQYFLFFLFSYGIYTIINKIVQLIFVNNSILSNRQSYLGSQILWGNVSLKECIRNIKNYVGSIIFESTHYFGWLYLIAVIIVCLVVVIILKKQYNIGCKIWGVIGSLLLLASPFFLSILLGNKQDIRAQFSFPMLIACCIFFGATIFGKKKFVRAICVFILTILCFFQTIQMANIFMLEYLKYQEDVGLASQITEKIDQLEPEDGNEPVPVMFVGAHSSQLMTNLSKYKWETIGYSFFEWDSWTEMGSNNRILGFLATLGKNYKIPTTEEARRARVLSENLPSWPNKNSVQKLDNIIIVKLSN